MITYEIHVHPLELRTDDEILAIACRALKLPKENFKLLRYTHNDYEQMKLVLGYEGEDEKFWKPGRCYFVKTPNQSLQVLETLELQS